MVIIELTEWCTSLSIKNIQAFEVCSITKGYQNHPNLGLHSMQHHLTPLHWNYYTDCVQWVVFFTWVSLLGSGSVLFFPGATCGVWWAWAIRGQGRGGYLWFISGHNSRKGASCWYSKSVAHIVSVTLPLNRQLCWHTLPCRSAWLPASTVCGHREREREPRGFSKQLRSAQTHTHTPHAFPLHRFGFVLSAGSDTSVHRFDWSESAAASKKLIELEGCVLRPHSSK